MSASQSNEPKPPAESPRTVTPPTTPLAPAETVLSLLPQSSSPRDSSADAPTQTSTLDAAQTVLSIPSQPPVQQENPSDAPALITPLSVEQAALSRLASPPTPRENSGDASTSAASAGAVKAMLSRHGQPSTHRVAQTSQPAPEPPQERSMNVPQHVPQESLQRGPEPTSPTSYSTLSRGAMRTSTPPHGTASAPRHYQAPRGSPPPVQSVFPHQPLYRHSEAPYPNSEATWLESRDTLSQKYGRNVRDRLEQTKIDAQLEVDKAKKRASWTGWAVTIAIGLQVFFGALTTALGAALSGKRSSVAISILGGASTLVASFLARARGSNEPEVSLLRAKALKHFVREINGFIMDHGHEIGPKWDDRVNGFRLGLENMLGNRSGSVMIKPGGGTNGGQDKGLPGMDPGMGGNWNSATNAKPA